MSGNTTMLIWLGKQHLRQQDRPNLVDFDVTQCTDEQLERILAGEDASTVMAWVRK